MKICKKRLWGGAGFTLAELLVVIAIIGVLVAVSIPIFTSQLEKSRRAVDMANARNIKSVLCAAMNDGTLEMEDGAKLAVQIRKNDWPVLYVQGRIKFKGTELYNKTNADHYTLKSNQTGVVGNMIGLLNQAVGDVLSLSVKASTFMANNGKESKIAWYAVRLTSDGTCRYGKGGGSISDHSILNTYWSDEEF